MTDDVKERCAAESAAIAAARKHIYIGDDADGDPVLIGLEDGIRAALSALRPTQSPTPSVSQIPRLSSPAEPKEGKMKPTPLSEYLATPAENRAPGWVVVIRGAGAPSVVHASRGAAEAEANRLIEGLPGMVDQTALVMPIASVLTRKKDVRQKIVGKAFPIELWPDRTNSKMEADIAEITSATGYFETVVSGSSPPPAPLTVKPHGIYERRDGKIVSIRRFTRDGGIATQDVGDAVYAETGRANYPGNNDAPQDLIREIVVGEGWLPWNGGGIPIEPSQMVEVCTRGNAWGTRPAVNYCWLRQRTKHRDDIVAYRKIEKFPF